MRLLENESADSLTLSWDAVSCVSTVTCNSISSYPYKLVNVVTGMIMIDDTTGTSVTIPNLEPCTSYRFSVAATNEAGTTGVYGSEVGGTTTLAGNVTF